MRYHLTIEYDGTAFVGWQRQDNGPSVQAALEKAIEDFSGRPAAVYGAGRTDSGVHALGQAMHCDIEGSFSPDAVKNAVNYYLGDHAISVIAASEVEGDFHARFSALRRHYEYRIICRKAPLTLERGHAWLVRRSLDEDAMAVAARHLIGHHDFTTFRSIRCQAKSPIRTLDNMDVTRSGDAITITAIAQSFLHNQVRSMVGSLKKVGEGSWDGDHIATILAATDRVQCGPVAPAHGLYLTAVDYP